MKRILRFTPYTTYEKNKIAIIFPPPPLNISLLFPFSLYVLRQGTDFYFNCALKRSPGNSYSCCQSFDPFGQRRGSIPDADQKDREWGTLCFKGRLQITKTNQAKEIKIRNGVENSGVLFEEYELLRVEWPFHPFCDQNTYSTGICKRVLAFC